MYVAIGQGQIILLESKFDQYKKFLYLLSSVVNFRKICLTCDFIKILLNFTHYTASGAGTDNPMG